jgi:hypothetical protein
MHDLSLPQNYNWNFIESCKQQVIERLKSMMISQNINQDACSFFIKELPIDAQ